MKPFYLKKNFFETILFSTLIESFPISPPTLLPYFSDSKKGNNVKSILIFFYQVTEK
jgi:hypothetical protein